MLSMSKPVMPVPPKRLNSQPPTTAPTMPSRMSTTVPSPVVLTILLAIRPAPSPSRIHTIMDMLSAYLTEAGWAATGGLLDFSDGSALSELLGGRTHLRMSGGNRGHQHVRSCGAGQSRTQLRAKIVRSWAGYVGRAPEKQQARKLLSRTFLHRYTRRRHRGSRHFHYLAAALEAV